MSRKKIKFEHPPILIGDRAMQLYKLQPNGSEQAEMVYVLVSTQDYEVLKETYGSSEVKTDWQTHVHDEKGFYYFLNWYNFTYESSLPNAVKIKNKLVVDKQTLLFMILFPAFDKKNKITRNMAKKHLQDTMTMANSFI